MKTKSKIFYWAPRVVGILTILYLSLFALDVFVAGVPFWNMLLGLAIHLIPNAVLVAILIFSWKYERIGGLLFVLVSFVPFFFLSNTVWVNAFLCAPFFLTGVLFVTHSFYIAKSTYEL